MSFRTVDDLSGGGAKGVTGFNPDTVKKQISDFYQYESSVSHSFIKTIESLFSSLRKSWFSPLAVKFANYSDSIRTLISDLNQGYERIIVDAVRAYNIHAKANGLSPIDTHGCEERPYGKGAFVIDMVLLEKSTDGVVGMIKGDVREALAVFRENVSNCIKLVDDTPYNIDIYDENGSQMASFKYEINRLKEKLVSSLTEMEKNINLSLEKEIEVVSATTGHVTESLSGSKNSVVN